MSPDRPATAPSLASALACAVGGVCAAAVLLLPRGAHAAEVAGCAIEVHPADAAPAWKQAVDDLRPRLADALGDCRRVDVDVALDGAVVAFTTRDGRQAVRRIASPSDLAPTVEALRVTLPSASTKDAALEQKPAPAMSPDVSPKGQEPLAEAPASPLHLALSLYVGARAAWPGRFVSPVLGTAAAVRLSSWDIGIYGQWETSYASSGNLLPPGFQMSALGAGAAFARRASLSEAVAGIVEGRLGLAVVSQEGSEANGEVGGDDAEARLGLAFGVAIPQSAPVRLRSMLGADFAPRRFGRTSRPLDANLPPLPKWGITLTIAMESDAL